MPKPKPQVHYESNLDKIWPKKPIVKIVKKDDPVIDGEDVND